MIDLGKHALPVLSAYGASLLLLALIIVASLRRSKKVAAELKALEEKQNG